MFTKEQLKNLQVFLSRSTMSGAEVPVFVDLMKVIAEGISREESENEK